MHPFSSQAFLCVEPHTDMWWFMYSAQAEIYREDFETERMDRKKAYRLMESLREMNKQKVEQVRQAQQEIQAKASQVKQYKKHVDSLKTQVS